MIPFGRRSQTVEAKQSWKTGNPGYQECFCCGNRHLDCRSATQQLHKDSLYVKAKRWWDSARNPASPPSIVCHPFWKNDPICARCAKMAPRCVVCERPSRADPALALGNQRGREPLYLCHKCGALGRVETEDDLLEVVGKAVEFFVSHPQIRINVLEYFTITVQRLNSEWRNEDAGAFSLGWERGAPILYVQFSNIHDLSRMKKSSNNDGVYNKVSLLAPANSSCQGSATMSAGEDNHSVLPIVRAWDEEIIFGKFEQQKCLRSSPFFAQKCFYQIQLCHKLQKETLISVLVHELFHALLAVRGITMQLDEEEALCNAITILYLNSFVMQNEGQRSALCDFRCRRLLVGDTPSTARLVEALDFFSNPCWKKQLTFD